MDIWQSGETGCQRVADLRLSDKSRAPMTVASGHLHRTIFSEMRHDAIEIMIVEGVQNALKSCD
jgi:hypothetical protein